MLLFKTRDVNFLHSRHDTINILAISDNNSNEYLDVLKKLESECKKVDENESNIDQRLNDLTHIIASILEKKQVPTPQNKEDKILIEILNENKTSKLYQNKTDSKISQKPEI